MILTGPTLIGEVPLCLHCNSVLKMAEVAQARVHAALYNLAVQEMDALVPIGPPGPRIEVEALMEPPVNNMTNIIGSQIGVLNTGAFAKIEATIGSLNMQGHHAASEALSTLTQAIATSTSATEAAKRDMLEQTSVLAEAMKKPDAERQKSIIRLVAGALATTLGTFADLSAVWDKVGPIILSALGL
jgi:hypothetical protein